MKTFLCWAALTFVVACPASLVLYAAEFDEDCCAAERVALDEQERRVAVAEARLSLEVTILEMRQAELLFCELSQQDDGVPSSDDMLLP